MTTNEVLQYLVLYGPTLLTVLGTLLATFKVDQKTKKNLSGVAYKMAEESGKLIESQGRVKVLEQKMTRVEDKQDRYAHEHREEIKRLEDKIDYLTEALGVQHDKEG